MAKTKISNVDFWNKIRKAYPTFASHTSEGTADMFTERGYEKIKNFDHTILEDFFELSLRVWLNIVNVSHAVDTLARNGFGESYDQPWGGYIQRMATYSVKPVSPAYKNLKDGDSPDQFVVRKPESTERFWTQNFDYQSLITMPDDFHYKQMFVAEYGFDTYFAGIMAGLENGYIIQKYENKLEALNSGINSTDTPLKDTQHIVSKLSATATDDEIRDFILAVNNAVEAMEIGPQTTAFNAMSYPDMQDKSRLRLLVRPGLKNTIKVKTLAGAFNPSELNFDVELVVVPHFGGLIPYKDEAYTTKLYPVYDKLGAQIGFAETEKSTEVTVNNEDVYWKDPNSNVNAILADKGIIAEFTQNPYTVEPVRNARGRYTNYWASSPNNAIIFDPLYNCILFENS